MHHSIPEQGRWLGNIVRGYLAYYAVPTNTRAIGAFRWEVVRIWRQALKRQSQRARASWKRMDTLAARWLPTARVLHPWTDAAFHRQSLEVRARCVNCARRDLRGGRATMLVPTAISWYILGGHRGLVNLVFVFPAAIAMQ
jgi:hypothetical protein